MHPIDERKDKNITCSIPITYSSKELINKVISNLNDLELFEYNFKIDLNIKYKKNRNKMKHLTPKKKKRKK